MIRRLVLFSNSATPQYLIRFTALPGEKTMNTKNIPVTMLLSEVEFSEFKNACSKADVKHSVILRNLSHAWMRRQQSNDRRHRFRPEYTGRTQNIPMSVPAKGGSTGFHVRL